MPQINSNYFSAGRPRRSSRQVGAAVFIVLFALFAMPVLADDVLHRSYQTRYARIHYLKDDDLYSFTGDIAGRFSFWTDRPKKNVLLAKNRVDSITDAVMKLLDMRPVELMFSIRIYRNKEDLELAYRRLGMTDAVPPAFYSHTTRSISVSLENISSRILAHEIAHAVICAWFASPPPRKMQEILAQYVDANVDASLEE